MVVHKKFELAKRYVLVSQLLSANLVQLDFKMNGAVDGKFRFQATQPKKCNITLEITQDIGENVFKLRFLNGDNVIERRTCTYDSMLDELDNYLKVFKIVKKFEYIQTYRNLLAFIELGVDYLPKGFVIIGDIQKLTVNIQPKKSQKVFAFQTYPKTSGVSPSVLTLDGETHALPKSYMVRMVFQK